MACCMPVRSSTRGHPRLSTPCRLCNQLLTFPQLDRSLCGPPPPTLPKALSKTNHLCHLHRATLMLALLRGSRLLFQAMHPLRGVHSKPRVRSQVMQQHRRCLTTTRLSLPQRPMATTLRLLRVLTAWLCRGLAQLSSHLVRLLVVAWQVHQSCRPSADWSRARSSWAVALQMLRSPRLSNA
jgi:hypothetical protein